MTILYTLFLMKIFLLLYNRSINYNYYSYFIALCSNFPLIFETVYTGESTRKLLQTTMQFISTCIRYMYSLSVTVVVLFRGYYAMAEAGSRKFNFKLLDNWSASESDEEGVEPVVQA